jgi:hypothetical protein
MSATRLSPLSAIFAAAVAAFAFVFAPATAADPNPTPDPDLGCRLPQASAYCTGAQKGPDTCRGGTIQAGIPGPAGVSGGPGSVVAPGVVAAAPPPMGGPHNSRPSGGHCGPYVIPGSNAGGGPGPGPAGLPGLNPDLPPTRPTGDGGVRPRPAGQQNR